MSQEKCERGYHLDIAELTRNTPMKTLAKYNSSEFNLLSYFEGEYIPNCHACQSEGNL